MLMDKYRVRIYERRNQEGMMDTASPAELRSYLPVRNVWTGSACWILCEGLNAVTVAALHQGLCDEQGYAVRKNPASRS
jgi:hypothetical protein